MCYNAVAFKFKFGFSTYVVKSVVRPPGRAVVEVMVEGVGG